jgi:hypothetical protein
MTFRQFIRIFILNRPAELPPPRGWRRRLPYYDENGELAVPPFEPQLELVVVDGQPDIIERELERLRRAEAKSAKRSARRAKPRERQGG